MSMPVRHDEPPFPHCDTRARTLVCHIPCAALAATRSQRVTFISSARNETTLSFSSTTSMTRRVLSGSRLTRKA